jgi:hypothetical protein
MLPWLEVAYFTSSDLSVTLWTSFLKDIQKLSDTAQLSDDAM